MKNTPLPVVAILLCSVVYFGCDTGSELFVEKEKNGDLEYEYVEVDLALMAKLGRMTDTDAVGGEPQIEFFDDREPIKRFWSEEDYYISADLIWEKSRLTGEPILIHQSLQRYLEYQQLIPIEELALVNYEGRLIIGDTLYTLSETSYYLVQHIDGPVVEKIDLSAFDPSREMKDYLTKLLQDQGASRLTDVLVLRKSANSSEEHVCGEPNDFGFAGGVSPARSNDHTDMCAWDFNYPSIKANPGDNEFTSNSPGAVVMWNTSYSIGRRRRGIANTQFFKYRDSNGGYFLDYVSSTDLPNVLDASVSVTVTTSRGSNSSSGILSTWSSNRRTGGRGTRSTHTATFRGVSGLPINHPIN